MHDGFAPDDAEGGRVGEDGRDGGMRADERQGRGCVEGGRRPGVLGRGAQA